MEKVWVELLIADHNINTSKCKPWSGSSYIKLPNKLDHPRKSFINIQNIDNDEWFICSFVRYLYLPDHHPGRIHRKYKETIIKEFVRELDFKGIKFSIKIRDIHKIEKNNGISISGFGYENKDKYPIHVS